MENNTKKRGFTLVELMAIIGILAVILVITVPQINNYILLNKKQTFITNALNILRQLEYDNMDFMSFDKAYIKDFDLKEINKKDIDVENSLVYVQDREIYIDLVGKGAYEGFYVCNVGSSSKNVVVQEHACGTTTEGLTYVDFDVDLDGGKTSQEFADKYGVGNYLVLQIPKKEGQTFNGWEIVTGNSIISENRIKFGTEATRIKAKWKGSSILTIDLNGGDSSQPLVGEYVGGTIIRLAVPTRTDYTFTGWEIVEGDDSIISGNMITMGSENTKIKAKWKINIYTINYDLNGGTEGSSMPTSGLSGRTVTVSNPTRTGYTFNGWTVTGDNASMIETNLIIGTSDMTLTANWTINTYTISYDLDGGTAGSSAPASGIYGSTVTVSNPTKEEYTFNGWTVSEGATEGALLSGTNLTIGAGNISLTANWIKTVTEYAYTGGEQTYTIPITGYYKLEVWGAQGGIVTGGTYGGTVSGIDKAYGGYSTGVYYANKGDILYINVGGKGENNCVAPSNGTTQYCEGGYNGGGSGISVDYYGYVSGGGGATHIATSSGLLSDLSENQDSILIVAGGGGGSSYYNYDGAGKKGYGQAGGGVNGGSNGGTQTSGSAFGKGATASSGVYPGGGGGLYGGNTAYMAGGGAGSGYIGNSLLKSTISVTKHMTCINCSNNLYVDYNVNTITHNLTCKSENATEDCSKIGNGHVKITFLYADEPYETIEVEESKTFDFTGTYKKIKINESGYYKLEVWGAQGGIVTGGTYGGTVSGIDIAYGGYSTGVYYANKGDILYINVGSKGENNCVTASNSTAKYCEGGYNGGGFGLSSDYYGYVSGGGGATHIATKNGLLSDLSENQDSILIVAGGGGGSSYYNYDSAGKKGYGQAGGGVNGGTNGGTQTSGNAFGKGATYVYTSAYQIYPGGGGGFYGGNTGSRAGGGAGSGYIGNPLLTNKAMYCYNCTTSDETDTKTLSTTCAEETPTENCAKIGNGYARITFISR